MKEQEYGTLYHFDSLIFVFKHQFVQLNLNTFSYFIVYYLGLGPCKFFLLVFIEDSSLEIFV
jgi:hypothetical protein